MKLISVIMPVYNEPISYLRDSILSIINQTYNNFEFIIVDDNPTNIKIKKYLIYESHKDNRIKLIFNSYNMGPMASANRAIKEANGEYIARMDADDISLNNRLYDQLRFCIKYNLDFSCCNLRAFDLNGVSKIDMIPDITQVNQNKIQRIMSHINIAIGPALFFKRNIIYKTGSYRNVVCEDYDLAIKSLVCNYRMGFLSKPLVMKRNRKHNISTLKFLQEFVSWYSISKYTRQVQFNKVISMSRLENNIDSISKQDITRYKKFTKYSKQLKLNKSLILLIKKYYYALSSPFMCKWSFFTKFTRPIQAILLKI